MNVVISGTSNGIGLATAKKFIAEGHAVFGYDVAPAGIEDAAYTHTVHDVRDTLPVDEAARISPEIIIMSAGTIEEADALSVNLEGAIRFTESFLGSPALKSVLFVASASARNGAEFPRYVASKAGLVGYMKYLANELGKRGITVNSISPGGVITSMNAHILESPTLYEAVLAETLLGKWAEPEEVADLAFFLTAVNRSITGEDILMDNGEQLKSNFIW